MALVCRELLTECMRLPHSRGFRRTPRRVCQAGGECLWCPGGSSSERDVPAGKRGQERLLEMLGQVGGLKGFPSNFTEQDT